MNFIKLIDFHAHAHVTQAPLSPGSTKRSLAFQISNLTVGQSYHYNVPSIVSLEGPDRPIR
jgi:hypothetical protein